jgi:hypothetical protein
MRVQPRFGLVDGRHVSASLIVVYRAAAQQLRDGVPHTW